jgi:hypothetical protein
MAFISGGNLAALLAREPRQPIDEVRRLLGEVADALAYAHLHGVIHRDIKPDNILLDGGTGRAAVTDFGIARAMEGGSRLTVTGIAVGTPTYMSPEQAEGEREIDGRSDLYSLGVVGYQMLTGRVPFTGGNTMALLLKHVTERPRPVAELRPDAPRALREAVERALMKNPEDRWPTAAALRDALRSDDAAAPSWRADRAEPVRYTSPIPESRRRDRLARESARADSRSVSPKRGSPASRHPAVAETRRSRGDIVMEPEHLASLTPEQRADIRLWHGRVNLRDRIKAMRGYSWLTLAAMFGAMGGLVAAIDADAVPLVLAPIVPLYMTRRLWLRGKSLRASGLKLRRVLLMPRAKWVIPTPKGVASQQALEQLASREILDGPFGAAVRRAAEDRAAILDTVAKLSPADRALVPEVEPTANALVERVVSLAQAIERLDEGIDPRLMTELDARIADLGQESVSPGMEQRLAMLRRQRETLEQLVKHRALLARQLDSAGLALGNLRLDLLKLRSSGLSALSDVSSATQEARALSREIGAVLEAAADVRSL